MTGARKRAAAVWDAVVPDWLAAVVRPKPAPLPWPDMIRAALGLGRAGRTRTSIKFLQAP